jgi:predicted dienelactone hydrolase
MVYLYRSVAAKNTTSFIERRRENAIMMSATRLLRHCLAVASIAMWAAVAGAAPEPSPTLLTVNPIVLKDPAQGKDLSIRVTLPMQGERLPIILFSHGASYSKDDYLPLTEFWAAHGYVVIQPTHIESASIGLPRDDPRLPSAWKDRILDMRFILDSLGEIERQAPLLKGRMDPKHVIAAGHSFGGHTAAALTAAHMPDMNADLTDPRIAAAIMLAPPPLAAGFRNVAWGTVSKPMLLIAGDQDVIKGFNDKWQDHADYYYKGPTGQCLAVMTGEKHYLGGILGIHRTEEETPNPQSLAAVQTMTLAFLNTEAKGAKDWDVLRQQLLTSPSTPIGIFECK